MNFKTFITLLNYDVHTISMNRIFAILLATVLLSQSAMMSSSVLAQNNSSLQKSNISSVENQTTATLTGQAETILLNKTTIPAEQTTVTIDQTTEQVQGQLDLEPIGNQTLVQQTPQLSDLENETMVEATGPAVTTIVNKTVTPFDQTMIGSGQLEEQQQSNQTNQTSQQQQQQNSSGGGNTQNQNQGPLDQLGESVGNLFGG